MNIDEFTKAVEALGLKVTSKELEKLDIIYNTLIETNKSMNLTRITEKTDVYLKHFYDSLTLVKVYDLSKAKTLCDIGTGAGFPGLIIKIFYPDLEITLVDSLLKRVNYLNNLIEKLNLKGIKAYHKRAEELIKEGKKFDIVTARAVASLPKLLLWTMPLVNKSGSFLAMKGNVEEELIDSSKIILKNNYYLANKIIFTLPQENSTRTILEFKHKNDKR